MKTETYGKYELEKRLAAGGMAEIFLARLRGPEGFEKPAVVKRILPHLAENKEFVDMFLDEARIAARLSHPNIVQIRELGAEGDTYFIAMEYIHGEDLRRVTRKAAELSVALPVQLVCRIIMDVCAGLDYAHKMTDGGGRPLGIVHRDVSPQNILLTFEGGVQVVDFGIAKAADKAVVTRSGVLKGKYSYMSPEQAAGQPLDHRSDIFAVGIVLWELLTGERLFRKTNDIQTLQAVAECKVPRPSDVHPELPPTLDEVVLRALEKDPDHRYQSAADLQLAIEEWVVAERLPSSSLHLKAFMQNVFQERLVEEGRSGKLLVEGADTANLKALEEASRQRLLRPAIAVRGTPPRGAPGKRGSGTIEVEAVGEQTAADRPRPSGSRGGPSRLDPQARPFEGLLHDELEEDEEDRTEAMLSEVPEPKLTQAFTVDEVPAVRQGGGAMGVVALVLLALGAAGALGFSLHRHFRGEELPDLMSIARDADATPGGDAASGATDAQEEPGAPATDTGRPSTRDGRSASTAPGSHADPRGGVPERGAAGSGVKESETVPAATSRAEKEPVARTTPRRRQRARAEKTPDVAPAVVGTGEVQFIVHPFGSYASVRCGERDLGETPFGAVELPAGSHRCSFSNPTDGILRKTVVVRTGERTIVQVAFK